MQSVHLVDQKWYIGNVVIKNVKSKPYLLPSVGPRADSSVQPAPAVGCHYFPPGMRLPSQPQSIIAPWPVPSYTAWWQRHIGVSNLPKVVTQLLPRVGFVPTTCWLQLQCPTRCAAVPPDLVITVHLNFACMCICYCSESCCSRHGRCFCCIYFGCYYCRVEFTTPGKFFTELEGEASKLCCWSGELYLELHSGTYTTQAKVRSCSQRFISAFSLPLPSFWDWPKVVF